MAKIKKVQLIRYAPFDVPDDDSELIHGENSVHVGAMAYTSVVRGEIKWFVGSDFDNLVKLVVERGAIRGKDYFITLSHHDKSPLPTLALHTTHDFISQEDV